LSYFGPPYKNTSEDAWSALVRKARRPLGSGHLSRPVSAAGVSQRSKARLPAEYALLVDGVFVAGGRHRTVVMRTVRH